MVFLFFFEYINPKKNQSDYGKKDLNLYISTIQKEAEEKKTRCSRQDQKFDTKKIEALEKILQRPG